MKRKRHHRTASHELVAPAVEVDPEDRLEQLLEAAGAGAMPQASDGDGGAEGNGDGDGDGDGEGEGEGCLPAHEHSDHLVSDSMAKKRAVVVEVPDVVPDMVPDAEAVEEEELALPDMVASMRRCGLCGGTTDGEPAADVPSEVPVGQANGILKPQDESCLADVTIDTKKSDGFGTENGWLGRLLGPLGEQFGVGGVWVHENCAIWSPEVYFSGIGRLKNVKAALRRGRLLRCSLCNQPGATIGCRVDRCPQNYHLPCARAEGCMFNHRKYLMACYDHSYLFKRRKKKRYWFSKSVTAQQGGTHSENSNPPRISKAQRRASAAAARLKDIEAEEKYLDKSGEDEEFVRRERKRLHRDLAQIAPVKLGGGTFVSNQGVASEGWDSVAGLQDVVQCLKEMVTLPLLYPEAFTRLGISAPRGVLLHGHPGTGKTLVVRALAGACSRGGQQVSYFARKGADILGKYVGDSERQLRLLFQVAEQCQPAIIFFDEIDGLAPSRCGDRDQTQSSVVSTLLALMDGLSSRGSVVVIGATNRPDSLDPALRRPGRFDREIYFPLPSTEDRASILRLHTRTWSPAPSPEILSVVAKATPGFAGADLQALCVEAAMTALRRVVPLKYILDSAALKGPLETKLPSLPPIQVKAKDWAKAVARAPLPCSRRLASTSLTQVPAGPLPRHLAPTLLPILVEVLVKLGLDGRVSLPPLLAKAFSLVELALKAASNLHNTDKDLSNEGANLPERWHSMVLDCFKETPSLAKALEDAFLDTGIMVDTYGAPCLSQPTSTVQFGDDGTCTERSRVAFKNSKEPSSDDVRIPTCMRQILSDENIDETDFAAKLKWSGCKFRILLLGGAQQGQKFVAGALINGFEGLAQTRTLSLPAMLMEGGGDVEQGLIYIIGEAMRSGPCLLYMPKIEDWVVGNSHDGEGNESGNAKHPEGFGTSNAQTEYHLREGRPETSLESEDEAALIVSVAWKLMKQQLQTMPPDTQLMLLATCESGVEALPLEVVNYFCQPETASRKSSLYLSKVSPCALVEFTSCHDPKGLLERASQDIARALAAGFGSRIARLREEYTAGCSAEKPKLNTAAGIRLPTSVQQIIAEKVSQIRTRVREDLGRDLRNIGQDWARNLGESPYANDVAKVFGIDVGRGLGLDLGLEFRNLESGLVEEVTRECSVGVEDRTTGDVGKCDVGASCLIRDQSNEQNSIDMSEQALQGSTQGKGARFVISGGRSLDFGEADGNENDLVRKALNLRGTELRLFYLDQLPAGPDVCATADLMKDTQNHLPPREVEHFEGEPTSELLDTAGEGGSKQAVAEESSATWTMQRKALQSAIAFCGYRFLRDPQLAGLRNATTMLKSVPVVDINDCKDAGTFNWETLEYQTSSGRRKDEVPEPVYVRGLTAVGFKACRGVYRTGREVEYEFRRVIETLYERVQQKIDSGKDSLQYFHLTTQAATLVDLMASWVLEVRKLEIAANMHNLPIAKSILEDEYMEEEQQESERKQGDENTYVEAANGEHHSRSTEVSLSEAGEGRTEQVENGFMHQHGSKSNCASNDNVDAQRLEVNGFSEVAKKKDGFTEDMPTIPNVSDIQPKANGIARGALEFFAGEISTVNPAVLPAGTKCKTPDRNGSRSQQKSPAVETNVERDLPGEKVKLLSSFIDLTTPEPSRQQGALVDAALPVEDSTSVSPALRAKCLRQAVRFKPDCFHHLESVVREFLDLSCKADISNSSVEVLHDLITGCASSALAASHNVLNKSEKTNITHQVILQWAGLTCHCGGDKTAELEFGAMEMGGSPRQLVFSSPQALSKEQMTPICQASSRKSKKRKKSRLSLLDSQAPPAKRLSISAPETSHALPAGLVSPMKQTNSKKSYTCLRPVIRAVKNMVDDFSSSKESNRKFDK